MQTLRWALQALVGALQAEGVDCCASDNAGRFVCNYVYYASLAAAEAAAAGEVGAASQSWGALYSPAANSHAVESLRPAGVAIA